MNFLGHAFVARNQPHLIAGNFAGDSYKGLLSNFEYLPKNILDGIKLHRYIDDFTDHSEHILAAGQLLQDQGIQRIAYIATDILLDHYLSKNWKKYSTLDYADFVQTIYDNTDPHLESLEEDFKFLYTRLKKYNWLFDYPEAEGIRKILHQFSVRIGFKNNLDECLDIYLSDSKTFDLHFEKFLASIQDNSIKFIEDL